jgi:hypothetical protein
MQTKPPTKLVPVLLSSLRVFPARQPVPRSHPKELRDTFLLHHRRPAQQSAQSVMQRVALMARLSRRHAASRPRRPLDRLPSTRGFSGHA